MLKLWNLEDAGFKKAKVRDILELFKAEGSDMAYTTLATFVKILVTKKFASASKIGNLIFIKSKVSRSDYAVIAMNYALDDYFGGDKEQMIAAIKAL